MATTTSRSKRAAKATVTSAPAASKTNGKRTLSQPATSDQLAPQSRAAYMKAFREKRSQSVMLRIREKLRMLRPMELKGLEMIIDQKLGKERLPNPKHPWHR